MRLFRRIAVVFLCSALVIAVAGIATASVATPTAPTPTKQAVTATMLGMPLQFEANHGQVDAQVKFLARGKGYTLFLTPTESVMVLRSAQARGEGHEAMGPESLSPLATSPVPATQSVVRMKLEGANPSPAIDGMEQLPGIVNYFIGNDPEKWRTKIPTYAKVHYKEAYPGIDLAYYGNQGKLEYDFIVAPGADPKQIKLAFEGASDIRLADSGDLLLTTALGEVRLQKPIVYQLEADGHKTLVAGQYVVDSLASTSHASRLTFHEVHIQLASYDHAKPVVIDPVFVYATYLGGSRPDEGFDIAADSAGQAYVTGFTFSTDFPTVTPLPIQITSSNAYAFVAKIAANGSALLYSTYLGGNFGARGDGIAVDNAGQAYIGGRTSSSDFPMMNPFQGTYSHGSNGHGVDGFVTKLNATGSALLYSTYLGGNGGDVVAGISVDTVGQIYVAGTTGSLNFPTAAPLQARLGGGRLNVGDAFVAKFNSSGSALIYSTYLGGSGVDEGGGIAVDSSGQAYVTGSTVSTDFPTVNAFQSAFGGGTNEDVFVAKLNAAGSMLLYSTYLGGSGIENGRGIAVDAAGQAYVTGETSSSNFPMAAPFQGTFGGGNYDAFATKFNTTGSALVYSTYLGGSGPEGGRAVAVDAAGQAYFTGVARSTDFPTVAPFQAWMRGSTNNFIAKFSAGGPILYSSYLGGNGTHGMGIDLDNAGHIYVTGGASSLGFPTVAPLQPTGAGFDDAFVMKISDAPPNRPPVCSAAVATPATLWAPNHQFEAITISGVTDPDGDTVTITATGVTQDEPVSAKGDENTSPDAVIQAGIASVRVERSGNGDGRVYQINFRAEDGKGGTCTGSVTVGVPHSMKKGTTAIDSGQAFNSFGP